MKKTLWLAGLVLLTGRFARNQELDLRYDVAIEPAVVDSFEVALSVRRLNSDSVVFQFPVTAPGTYSVLDPGRYVGSFRAFDAQGNELSTSRINTNEYVIRNASRLAKLTYRMSDTYDAPIDTNPVYPMSGSNIEEDNALVNGPMVFGYFKGHQADPIRVAFRYPSDWLVGTALTPHNGAYRVENFDQLVDSPFLFGRLTQESLKIGGSKVDIYCYSQSGATTAAGLVPALSKMLMAADKFLDGLPVRHYVFLFHFRHDTGPIYGAWEHNYSSFYIIPEGGYETIVPTVISMAAHEFFHIVTPLNLHSDIIASFDFEHPRASRHLWLYEGATEWASWMMQVRAGLISDSEYVADVSAKLRKNDQYDPTVSLVELSLGSYDVTESQYQNIYDKGALAAMCLDMRLLELSQGRMGLNKLIRKLSDRFGPHKAFPDDQLFDIIVSLTHPEIRDFFERYIEGAEPLPIKAYLAQAGYDYEETAPTGRYRTNLGHYDFGLLGGDLYVKGLDEEDTVNVRLGIQEGDVILRLVYADKEIGLLNPAIATTIQTMKLGDRFGWVVRRDGREMTLEGYVAKVPVVEHHRILPMSNPTKDQLAFRTLWLGQ